LIQSEIGVLEEFAVIMYDRSNSTNKVNDASLDLFARKQRPYNGETFAVARKTYSTPTFK
jgi:hypothetical protein